MGNTPNDSDRAPTRLSAILLTSALIGGLHIAVGIILMPFVMPLLWAIVLTTSTWPAYSRLRARTPEQPWVPALGLTLLLGILLLLVTIPLPLELAGELRQLGASLSGLDVSRTTEALRELPLIGDMLADQLSSVLQEEGGLSSIISSHQSDLVRIATSAAKSILQTIAIILMALAGCFILYLRGESLMAEARAIIRKLGSQRGDYIFSYLGATVRGAAYSVIATAVAQGTLAGIGFSLAGAPLPLLLAVATMLLSLLPFGAPLLYVPVAVYLAAATNLPWYHSAGLLAWGIGVVSTADNVLRSLFISQATKISAVVVFMGVLGGVMAFGLIGVFIGPALVGIAGTLWHDFASEPSARA